MAQDTPAPADPRRLTREPPESAATRLARQLLTTEYQARTATGRAWQSLRTAMRALLNRVRPGRGSGGGGGGGGGFEGAWEQAPNWQQAQGYQQQGYQQRAYQQPPYRQPATAVSPNSPLGRLEAAIQSLDRPQREAFEDALLKLVTQKKANGDDSTWKKALNADLSSMPAVAHYASNAQVRAIAREAAATRTPEPASRLGSSAVPDQVEPMPDPHAITTAQQTDWARQGLGSSAVPQQMDPIPDPHAVTSAQQTDWARQDLGSSAVPQQMEPVPDPHAVTTAQQTDWARQGLSSSAMPTDGRADLDAHTVAAVQQPGGERFERGPTSPDSIAPPRPVSPAPSTTSVSSAANITPVSPLSPSIPSAALAGAPALVDVTLRLQFPANTPTGQAPSHTSPARPATPRTPPAQQARRR